MTPDEHDREAAFTQGVAHYIGRVLSDLGVRRSPIGTVGYNKLLEIVEQTCNDPLAALPRPAALQPAHAGDARAPGGVPAGGHGGHRRLTCSRVAEVTADEPARRSARMERLMAEVRIKDIDEHEIDTILAEDIDFEGHLTFKKPLMIKGKFKGEIKSTSALYIGEKAFVEATTEAAVVSSKGTHKGDIVGHSRVELFSTAQVDGDITTPDFVVESGCKFNGVLQHGRRPAEGRGAAGLRPAAQQPAPHGRTAAVARSPPRQHAAPARSRPQHRPQQARAPSAESQQNPHAHQQQAAAAAPEPAAEPAAAGRSIAGSGGQQR